MSVQRLPIEVMHFVVEQLGLDDVFNLSLACKQFHYLIRNKGICRAVLLSQARHSPEAVRSVKSGDYARGLRTAVKRRRAISGASPYQAAIVAVADDYIYTNGFLCYTLERLQLRILDIHGSSRQEIVIDTEKLLLEAVPESRGLKKYKFYPVHYAHGILSCVYVSKRKGQTTNALVLLDPHKPELVNVSRVDSVHRLFVRNDENYLYFGTHSMHEEDGFRRWVLCQFDLRGREWIGSRILLSDVVGSEIGAELCFEIFDGYFYGVSNEIDFELREIGSRSYYHAFRFPVGQPDAAHTEIAKPDNMLRRYHSDGVIDNRWNVLKLDKDEGTGQIMILECRKEFLAGECKSLRTCYKRKLDFSEPIGILEYGTGLGAEEGASADAGHLVARPRSPAETSGGSAVPEYRKNVHAGDDGSKLPIYTLSQCFVRSYVSSCESFVDIVNDPVPSNPLQQRLRLRVRCKGPDGAVQHPSDGRGGLEAPAQLEGLSAMQHNRNECIFWPPDQRLQRAEPLMEDKFRELQHILNPPSHGGNVRWAIDSRSLVYSTENEAGMSSIVLLGFDPSLRLHGLRLFCGGQHGSESGDASVSRVLAGMDLSGSTSGFTSYAPHAPAPRDTSLLAEPTLASKPLAAPWARLDDPMYFAISRHGHGLGFDFGR